MKPMECYKIHKNLAKRIFMEGVNLSKNPSGLPKWKLEPRLNRIITSLSELGYITTIDGLKPKSQGGFINEIPNLYLYYQFACELGCVIKEDSYPNPYNIMARLSALGLGRLCRSCGGTGTYTLASGAPTACATCNGTSRVVKIDSKTYKELISLKEGRL